MKSDTTLTAGVCHSPSSGIARPESGQRAVAAPSPCGRRCQAPQAESSLPDRRRSLPEARAEQRSGAEHGGRKCGVTDELRRRVIISSLQYVELGIWLVADAPPGAVSRDAPPWTATSYHPWSRSAPPEACTPAATRPLVSRLRSTGYCDLPVRNICSAA